MSAGLNITAIILAAGISRRMGAENKLLKYWKGKPLVEHTCLEAIGSGCKEILVVTGHQKELVQSALKHLNLAFTHNLNYSSGLASSISTGVSYAAKLNSDAVLILLGDMPQITSAMIDEMIEAAMAGQKDAIIVATSEGNRGNPLLWPACYFEQLSNLKGDEGARQIIIHHADKIVTVEMGKPARFDLDTPEAFKSTANP